MKHGPKKTVFPALCLLAALGMVFMGCSNPSGGGDEGPPFVAVSGVSLKSATTILIGGSEGLIAAITPSDATNKNVSWSSSAETIATVADGTVTAVAVGTAIITVTTEDESHTASCTVTVTVVPVAVSGVSLKSGTIIPIGGSEGLIATITPSNATNKNVSWSSSVEIIATVADGTVTAMAVGTTIITVTTEDGSHTASCMVTVVPAYTMKAVPAGEVNADSGESGGPFYNAGTMNVTVPAFYIGETEITYELWYAVRTWAVSNGYSFANAGKEGNNGTAGAAPTTDKQEPVTHISWRDAVVWCNAYSEALGKTAAYKYNSAVLRESQGSPPGSGSGKAEQAVIDSNADGFRLPTEAQWEYAARGGVPSNTTPWKYTYAGSSTADGVAVHNGNSGNKTAAVKSKQPNSLWLYDMSGNVWEWCQDVLGNTLGRVRRGGSWGSSTSDCTVAGRHGSSPGHEDNMLGFRVVCP